VLVARHENEIGGTTDVADHPEFADRHTTKVVDGTTISGWFTEDFTFAELRTLRAKERIPGTRPGNTAYDGQFTVPSLQQVLDLARRSRTCDGEPVGVYPETKHPSYFDSIGLSLEEPLLEALRRNRLDRRDAKVFVQSFEVSNLQELSRRTRVPLVQLIDARGAPADFVLAGDPRTYDDLVTRQGLAEIARYADGIGPEKSRIVPGNVAGGTLGEPTSLIADAHRAGLMLHPWTFRPENNFLAATFGQGDPASPEFLRARGDQPAELALYYRLGVDGLFADNPDTAVAVRETLRDHD
jgi:glycerophosphoryl diester phosphodiesterase